MTSPPALGDAPILAAFDLLRADGYEIEVPQIAEVELVVAGVGSGQFEIGTGNINNAAAAIQQGAPVKVIADRVGNQWTIYGKTSITSCQDLDGKRLAIHSEGAVSAAMARDWVRKECPGTEPTYLIIAGSQNRLAALLADQIDATPLELADAIQLKRQDPDGKFHLITDFRESLPDLKVFTIQANQKFLDENPVTVRAVLTRLLEVHRKIHDDPEYLKEIIQKYVPDEYDPETIDEVVATHVGLFDVNGGMTAEDVEYTLKFFTDLESIEPGMTVEKAADLDPLSDVLAQIGTK